MTEKEIKKLEKLVDELQYIIDSQNEEKQSTGRTLEARDHFYSLEWPKNCRHDFDKIKFLTCSAFRVRKLSYLDDEELKMAECFAVELSECCSLLYQKYNEKRREYIKEKMKKYANMPDR